MDCFIRDNWSDKEFEDDVTDRDESLRFGRKFHGWEGTYDSTTTKQEQTAEITQKLRRERGTLVPFLIGIIIIRSL